MICPEIERIMLLLNKRTFLADKMKLEKAALKETDEMRVQLRAKHHTNCLDHEPLLVENLTVSLSDPLDGPTERTLHFKGRLQIDQGSLVCFVGRNGVGKSTLLSLL